MLDLYRQKSYLHLDLFMTGHHPFNLLFTILTWIVQFKNGGNKGVQSIMCFDWYKMEEVAQ